MERNNNPTAVIPAAKMISLLGQPDLTCFSDGMYTFVSFQQIGQQGEANEPGKSSH